jgi:hypothetical protein
VPLYYFNVHNSIGFTEDEEGQQLADLDAARAEGLKGVRSILAEDVSRGHLDLAGRLEVVDGLGALVLTIPFSEAVAVEPPVPKLRPA